MGKWSKYSQTYKKEWENQEILKGWLEQRGEKGHCKYCNVDLRPHLSDLKKHATSQKHLKITQSRKGTSKTVFNSIQELKELTEEMKTKKFELQIALYIATKSSFLAVDDLCEILQNKFGKNAISMHRTKCTALVKKVLAPHFKNELCEEIKDTPFSIMVDESTDISCTKLVALSIRYYSERMKTIINTYLGSSEIVKADAVGLEGAVRLMLDEWKLEGKNMIGLGTDGAAAMVGEHNSLQALLRRTWPHITHIRCVCHALDLAARDAVRKAMPSNIEYMVRVTFNWFAHSFQRIRAYQEIAQLIGFSCDMDGDNEDEQGPGDARSKPLKLISPSETRWLVVADCVERILLQYDALMAHFSVAYQVERCYEAGVLHKMFEDEQNRMFMLFLHPVLKELRRITKTFQSNSGDNMKIYSELEAFFLALGTQILKPAILKNKTTEELCNLNIDSNFCMLPTEAIDFGENFLFKLERSKLSTEAKNNVLTKASAFLKELFMGLQKRLQGTFGLMKHVQKFMMPKFLENPLARSDLIAPFFPQDDTSLGEIEGKFRLLKAMKWSNTETNNFWFEVHSYQDLSEDFPFRILSQGVIKMLCLPTSNAEIERVFSQVNIIKNKKRSNMQTELLDAVLHCKFGLSKFGLSSHQFDPPREILSFNSNIY